MPDAPVDQAFPRLDAEEMCTLGKLGRTDAYADGQVVFRVGDADIDFFTVESGAAEIVNPTNNDVVVVTHGPGEFLGDIDMLTRRPVIVTAIARGPTRLIRVPGERLRHLLNTVPKLGEKLLVAFQVRRDRLKAAGVAGLQVVGPGQCRDTNLVREFLYKNFVPFTWTDPSTPAGAKLLESFGSPKGAPVVGFGGGRVMVKPTLREVAGGAGVWRHCPDEEVDLAVIGAGPSGIAAAVYAASEGLCTVVLDRLGPGGQAGGSSKIENFIGFPAGLSGADLATRGVLQMLKFGARMAAPVAVERLDPAREPGACHALHLDCGATIRSRVVLVATGVAWRKLEAEGAERFDRAGVYYACTSVEALIHDAQDVAVVGAGNSAGQAAMFLAECCRNRRVHMLVRSKLGPGMSEYLAARIRATANITVHEGTEVTAVHGDRGGRRIESVELKVRASDERPRLKVGAVFVFIGADPGARWLPESVARDHLGYLLTGVDAVKSGKWPRTDREPCPLETTIPGLLAAGDIRAGSTKRVGFAVGDGSLAVTCAHRLRSLGA